MSGEATGPGDARRGGRRRQGGEAVHRAAPFPLVEAAGPRRGRRRGRRRRGGGGRRIARRPVVLRAIAPHQPDDAVARLGRLVAAQPGQRQQALAVALHQPRRGGGGAHRLLPQPAVLVARLGALEQAVGARRQPHHQPVADAQLVRHEGGEQPVDGALLRQRGGEVAGAGRRDEGERGDVLRGGIGGVGVGHGGAPVGCCRGGKGGIILPLRQLINAICV